MKIKITADEAAVAPTIAVPAPPPVVAPPPPEEVDNTPVVPGDESSIITKLDKQGFIDYNSYETEPNGGATVRAIDTRNGLPLTLHFDRTGHMTTETGWQQ